MGDKGINVFWSSAFDELTLEHQFAEFGKLASKLADAATFARLEEYDSAEKILVEATSEASALKCNPLLELAIAVRNYMTGLRHGVIQPDTVEY